MPSAAPIRALVLLLFAGLACWFGWSELRSSSDLRARQQARELFQQAQQQATASVRREEARRWLQENGFELTTWNATANGWVGWERQQSPEGSEEFSVVEGSRQLQAKGWFAEPAWIVITFRFAAGSKFHDIEFQFRRAPLP